MTIFPNKLIHRVRKTQHGFLDIKRAADEVVSSSAPSEAIQLAKQLFRSEVHQARVLATFIFGRLAAKSKQCLTFLQKTVSKDPDWRVQETLAKAFDQFCADTGYEQSIPVIEKWLSDEHPNVRRAVTEGLRIWTSRPYFRDHPDIAVRLLSQLHDDESEYVRRSVGNALRDISRKHEQLVRAELRKWNLSNKAVALTRKLASKFL